MRDDDYDSFEQWKIDYIKEKKTRSGVIDFMRAFRLRVEAGKRLPTHWLQFAAELLGAAAEAAEETDAKKRGMAVTKAMRLSGRVDNSRRNFAVARAIHYLKSTGLSETEAKTKVSLELEDEFGIIVPEETLISIYKQYPRKILNASQNSLIAHCKKHDEDPDDVLRKFCAIENLVPFYR